MGDGLRAKKYTVRSDVVMDTKMPLTAHIRELRTSLALCLGTLLLGSTIAYGFFKPILHIFQAPLNDKLFYTSPAGGFTFVMKLCLSVGLLFAIPVLVNRVFNFAKPIIPKSMQRAFAWYSLVSVLLAVVGVVFAYFVSLPGALHFLTNFNKEQIQALITVDSYFNFVITYLLGYALLFQTPILMLFVNRVKPLDPGSMLKAERYVILGSFIVAAILTPTPDPWNQLLMAIPMVLLYQFGVVAIWIVNRNRVLVYTNVSKEALKAKIPAHLSIAPKSITVIPPISQEVKTRSTQTSTPVIQDFQTRPRVFDIISVPRTT